MLYYCCWYYGKWDESRNKKLTFNAFELSHNTHTVTFALVFRRSKKHVVMSFETRISESAVQCSAVHWVAMLRHPVFCVTTCADLISTWLRTPQRVNIHKDANEVKLMAPSAQACLLFNYLLNRLWKLHVGRLRFSWNNEGTVESPEDLFQVRLRLVTWGERHVHHRRPFGRYEAVSA